MSNQELAKNQELAEKIESWAALIADDARAANNGLMPDAEDMAHLARAMRDTALQLKHRVAHAQWDEAVAGLEVELDRLDLKELRMEEEVTLQGVPSEEWLYVINLDMCQLVNLQLRLSLLNKEQL